MDRYALEGVFGLTSYCKICENLKKTNGCEGCCGIVNIFRPDKDIPPSKFKSIYKVKKEEKKMIVTIIGSYSRKDAMLEAKAYWERFGHKVNCPCDDGRAALPLITKQSTWIEKIEEADLIVAIPKDIKMPGSGASSYVYEFGESTSYEMAIALRFKKQVVFW